LALYFFFFSFFFFLLFPSRSHYFYYCKLANTNYTQNKDRNSTKWNDGKTEKGWKAFSPKNKLAQDSEGDEENGYPVPDPNKTKIDYPKKPSEAQRTPMKKKSCKTSLRISWR
jgi:hypothetical protein